jgi:lambda repressor-like predicted transcriptional regulator
MNKMENNYNRDQLLAQALLHENVTLDQLAERMKMTGQEITDNLDNPKHVAAVARALNIDQAFFWGGMKYDENGKLVRT